MNAIYETEPEILIPHPELRLGYLAELYYRCKASAIPKQLDLLALFFPDLLVRIRPGDNNIKEAPEYSDAECMIYASKYHDRLYASGDSRVTQITAKLVGTASSNFEKERKSAELIQRQTARRLANEQEPLLQLLEHTDAMLEALSEEALDDFHFLLYVFVMQCAETYYARDPFSRDNELFPFHDEVFDQILYNTFYQLLLYSREGLVNAFLWLLLGSLLRNECGRICRIYDSSFIPVYKPASETGHLLDKLYYLINEDAYESFYIGDDLNQRFPGVEWYCDNCEDHLNEQNGFTDTLPVWQCRKCGALNPIDFEHIFETFEDYENDIRHVDREDFLQAIEKRRKEMENDK